MGRLFECSPITGLMYLRSTSDDNYTEHHRDAQVQNFVEQTHDCKS